MTQSIDSSTGVTSDAAIPSVSVVIPAYTMDRWPLITKAVESVRQQTVSVEEIVLCVDNNAELLQRAQVEWHSATSPPVRVLANRYDAHLAGLEVHRKAHGETRRFGAGSARNTATEVVTSDIVAYMDDDAWAEPDWIEQLLAVYQAPSIVAVGGAPLPDYATSRPAWYPANFDWVFGCAYDGLPTVNAPLGRLIGANMSVRREALAAVGGFHGDEFDDLNVCMRLADKYGRDNVYYAPGAVVHHYVPAKRVSWQYFYRRCYFVNREKVRAFRSMGSAANLSAESDFVRRAVRRGVVTEIKRALSGEPWAASRSLAAMLAGITLAAAGHARGQLDHVIGRGTS